MTYLGCVFSRDDKFNRWFENRRMNGNINKGHLERTSMIHRSAFRPIIIIIYGSEILVNSNNLMRGHEVKVLRMMSRVEISEKLRMMKYVGI